MKKKEMKVMPNKIVRINSQKELPFYAKKIPSISLTSYLERILKYTKMEDSTLIMVLCYIDKISRNRLFFLTSHNIHRLVAN